MLENTKNDVVPALVQAGLPVSSVEPFLEALNSGNEAAITAVPGVTKPIIGVGITTLKAAYSNAFTVLFLVTIAFGGCSIIAAFFTPATEDRYTNDVMRQLHPTGRPRKSPSNNAENKIQQDEAEHKESV